jgi:hypothetical protein
VPLDEMNPPPKEISDAQLRKDACLSARLPLNKKTNVRRICSTTFYGAR